MSKDDDNHSNPNVAINLLGWVDDIEGSAGKSTRLEIYKWIKHKNGEAYMKDRKGNIIKVITAETPRGTKYLTTEADTKETNNLLSLPECL